MTYQRRLGRRSCSGGVARVCLLVGASVLASLNAEASIIITQAESRAHPAVWLLNLGGQQGLAHQQVFGALVEIFDRTRLRIGTIVEHGIKPAVGFFPHPFDTALNRIGFNPTSPVRRYERHLEPASLQLF